MPDSVTQHIIDKGLLRFTPNTLCDPVRLRADLAAINERGYAIDDMEHEYGIRCVAVPIRNIGNAVVASMSISGPSLRFTEETIARNASLLLEVQQELRPLIGV
jgi:DNA-binding IclR family transcriptional regulator